MKDALLVLLAFAALGCPGEGSRDAGVALADADAGNPDDAGSKDDVDAGLDGGTEQGPFDAGCDKSDAIPPETCEGEPRSCADLNAATTQGVEVAFNDARLGCSADTDCTSMSVAVLCPADPIYSYGFCEFPVRKAGVCEFVEAALALSQAACDSCRIERCDSIPGCLPAKPARCIAGLCRFLED